MTGEGAWHVASLLVHADPARAAAVAAAIAGVAGAEVRASQGGKLVVILEAADDAGMAAGMRALADLDGVHAATLVYQHAEPHPTGDRP